MGLLKVVKNILKAAAYIGGTYYSIKLGFVGIRYAAESVEAAFRFTLSAIDQAAWYVVQEG